jgi:hypothetical protein
MSTEVLGLNDVDKAQYEVMRNVNGYQYLVAPANKFMTKTAQSRVMKITGGMNPRFSPEIFDGQRERLQMAGKKEKQEQMEALGVMYLQKLSEAFVADKQVDHQEFEKMLDPRYAPTYADASRALNLPVPWLWRQQKYETLENISRLSLEACNKDHQCTLSFEDWYQLFWNYGMPFNAVAYYCGITAQQQVYTQEYVAEFAHYLQQRLASQLKASDAPILLIGGHIGKLAYLINQTKLLRVPVIATHEKPNTNPILAKIPGSEQKRFQPTPIEKLKDETALEKYQPALVIMQDLKSNQDITQMVRSFGCVKEYVTVGLGDSYLEGHGWQTWGNPKYRDKDDTILPPYHADGYWKLSLNFVSRYALHKYDSDLAHGFGTVKAFQKRTLMSDAKALRSFRMRRLPVRF